MIKITNDTTTLNGALTELGETMASNLVTMGVTDATASDGLTTLAGKILLVPQGGGTTTISLTADKNILSYYNSESAVLSATVLENGSAKSGATVEFFKGSTSLGTATTNSSGVATKSYSANGDGDVSFTATTGSLTSSTVTIEDCLFYDTTEHSLTSGYALADAPTYASFSSLPNKFTLSFDFKTGGESRFGLFSQSNYTATTNPTYSVFIGSPNGSTKWYYGYRATSTSTTDISATPTDYHTYKISRNGNTFTYNRDNGTNYTKSVTWFDNYSYYLGMIVWGTSKTGYVKNIKLKVDS